MDGQGWISFTQIYVHWIGFQIFILYKEKCKEIKELILKIQPFSGPIKKVHIKHKSIENNKKIMVSRLIKLLILLGNFTRNLGRKKRTSHPSIKSPLN